MRRQKGLKRGPRSEETKAKLAAAQRGRIHTLEHRRKVSLAQQGKKWSPEQREKQRLLRLDPERGKRHSVIMKALWQDKEYVRKVRGGHRITGIEKTVYGWLNELGVRFFREHLIVGGAIDVYCPDFMLGVEVDGAYWHPEGNLRDRHKDWMRGMATIQTIRLPEAKIHDGEARKDLINILRSQWDLVLELKAIRAT